MCIGKLRAWFGGVVGESDVKTTQNLFYLFAVAVAVIVVVFIFVILLLLSVCDFPPASPSSCSYGEVGDLFGGILNPILTFLAFMGLLITIAVQKDELSQTRTQLTNSAVAQVEIAKLQKTELENSAVYSLLEALRDTGKDISLSKEQRKGSLPTRYYTESGSRATMEILNECVRKAGESGTTLPIDIIREVASSESEYISSHMSSYMEQVSYIIKWVQSNSNDKQSHFKLLAANMNYQEVYLAYVFSEDMKHSEFQKGLSEANLISYIPNHNIVIDEAFRVG